MTAQKFTDYQIIEAVHECRQAVDEAHGPTSLAQLGMFMEWRYDNVNEPIGRATLSLRIQSLIEREWLEGTPTEDHGTPAISLRPTRRGYEFIGIDADDIEPYFPDKPSKSRRA